MDNPLTGVIFILNFLHTEFLQLTNSIIHKDINIIIILRHHIQLELKSCTVTYLHISCSSMELCFELMLAHKIAFRLLFESIMCMELSDVNGNIVPNFYSRIVKGFLDVFKINSWDLQVPEIPYCVVGVPGPMMIFILIYPKGLWDIAYSLCHN